MTLCPHFKIPLRRMSFPSVFNLFTLICRNTGPLYWIDGIFSRKVEISYFENSGQLR